MLTDPAHCADWPRYLLAAPAADVQRLAARLAVTLKIEELTPSRTGAGNSPRPMSDPWFPADAPSSYARVRVVAPDGRSAEGTADIAQHHPSLAHAIAVLDAVLAGGLADSQALAVLLHQGAAAADRRDARRRAIFAAVRGNLQAGHPDTGDHR